MVFYVRISGDANRRSPNVMLNTLSLRITQIIMFSDLECDYINPIDLCNKLNQVGRAMHFGVDEPRTLIRSSSFFPLTLQFTLPEMAAHAVLTVFFLLSGQFLAFVLNAPLVAFNVNK